MRNAKTIIIGIACAMALAYIISGIYDKAVGGDNTDGWQKADAMCVFMIMGSIPSWMWKSIQHRRWRE